MLQHILVKFLRVLHTCKSWTILPTKSSQQMLIRCDYLWEKNDPDLYAMLHCMQLLMNMM